MLAPPGYQILIDFGEAIDIIAARGHCWIVGQSEVESRKDEDRFDCHQLL
jgi:hypothetical protein